MTVETKTPKLGDFTVEYLGCEWPDYFQGYGTAFSKYDNCAYGIGNTVEEALEDCIEMFAQSSDIDCTDDVVDRIRAAYGELSEEDKCTTATEALGVDDNSDESDESDESDYHDYEETPFFHVGIKWNETTD